MDYLDIRELYHHGIKGQRWGLRRYQNEDGTLTAEGRERYGFEEKPSNRLLRSASINRKDASDIRRAAKDAKNEKSKKDLLDSADALEKLAEKQEAKAATKGIMSKEGKKLYKQDKRDQKTLDSSNAGNAIRNALKTGSKYTAAGIINSGIAFVAAKMMIKAGNLEGAKTVIAGNNIVNSILGTAGGVHTFVSAVKGANEKDKIYESQKMGS